MTKTRKQKKNRKIKQDMAKKLLGYSAVAGAALAIAVPHAEAVPVTLTGPSASNFIDLDGNGADDVSFRLETFTFVSSSFGDAFFAGLGDAQVAKYSAPFIYNGNTTYYPAAKRFTNTSSINSGAFLSSFGQYGILAENFFKANIYVQGGPFLAQRGFLGVRFDSPLNGSGIDFAFIDLEVASDVKSLTIYNFGMVGASAPVPEPATLSTLALGLGGLYAMRRRSAKQKKGHKQL